MYGAQEKIGPYELRGELGRGAMARVWRAWDPNLEREVAIKEPLFDPRLSDTMTDELGKRFVGEGRAAARLSHSGIVTIYAADVWDGRPAIVMELVEGETLTQRLDRGPLAPVEALGYLDQLLDAVGYAHAHGVVHRDIKPDNIFVTPTGRVKLADFGIARVDDARLTMGTVAGTVLGTPGYMSPEQATGAPVDARSDLFSVGVVAYEMLSGSNPFGAGSGTDTTTLIYRIVHEPAPELPASTSAGLPADLRPAIMAALAKDPALRPQSAEELRGMLHGRGLGSETVLTTQVDEPAHGRHASTGTRLVTELDTGARGGAASYGGASYGRSVSYGGAGSYEGDSRSYRGGSGSHGTVRATSQGVGFAQGDRQGAHGAGGRGGKRAPGWLPYLLVAGIALVALGFVLAHVLGGGSSGSASDASGEAGSSQGAATAPASDDAAHEAAEEDAPSSSQAVGAPYYLAVSDGYVAIFSRDEATPYEVTDVAVADLGSASAAELDAHVPALSLDEAQGLVSAYRQEADAAHQVREEQEAQEAREADIAAHPFTISYADASSYLSSVGQASHYEPACVIDDDLTTSWNEGDVYTSGIGEWVSINATSEQWAHGLKLINGYPKSTDIYYKNNRCRDVTISLSDGFAMQVTLSDLYREWQTIDFGDYHKTSYIRLTINSVYGGSEWLDTSVCEMRAY